MRVIAFVLVALCSLAHAIKILPAIRFDRGSAVLRADTLSTIDDVADTLKKNDDILLVEVQGHCSTDDAATKEKLLELSDARARAVRDRLVALGVSSYRLTPVGYADTQPIDRKHDASSQSKNRRIEFLILKRKAR